MSDVATRTQWPAETIEAAYQIWSSTAGRNQAETRRQLIGAGLGDVPVSTLGNWYQAGNWIGRVEAETSAGTRIQSEQYVYGIWVAAPSCIRTLHAIATGTDPNPDSVIPISERTRAATVIVEKAQQLLLAQAKAKPGPKPNRALTATVDLSAMDSAQLEEYERTLRDTNATRDG